MHDVTLEALQAVCEPVLDAAGFIPGPQVDERYCRDWLGGYGRPLAVLRPQTPDQVARLMHVLHRLREPVVIQGGMTGLVGACVPQPGEVVLSLERLRTIEEFDTTAGTITAQAGVALQALQEHVEARGWMFPVDIGSRGSCQIGGIITTNAGGNRVLRHGMTRQSVLGLEVVLPDGSVVSRMGKALKDNDLKHLFIGSEGTLGVITRALLALQPIPRTQQTALISVAHFDEVVALLALCRQRLGAALSSFEVMWRDYYDTVTLQLGKSRRHFDPPGTHLVLLEAMGHHPGGDEEQFQHTLAEFLEQVPHAQMVLAQSVADARALWALRDASGEAATAIAPFAGFDVSLPIDRMAGWTRDMHRALQVMGLHRVQTYGHLGDGNLHLCVGGLPDADHKQAVEDLVHGSIGAMGGSISGEHGIGFSKRRQLPHCRSATEIALMQSLKRSIDPDQLVNRGRVFELPANRISP